MAKHRPHPSGYAIRPTRGRVLALYHAGVRPVEIARRLTVTTQNVRHHLRKAGRDAGAREIARRRAAERQERVRYAELWNAAPDVGAAARAAGLTVKAAQQRARWLRVLY